MGVSADQNMRAQNAMNLIWELYFGFDVKNKLVLPVVMVMTNFISVHKVILSYENYILQCELTTGGNVNKHVNKQRALKNT